MNSISRVWAALRGQRSTTIAPESPRFQGPVWWGGFGVPKDLYLSPDEQMSVSVAWACIRAIVDPIAASELKVYEDRDGKRTEDRDSWLYWLLNVEPHPQYTSQGWTESVLTSAVARGDGYAYIRRNEGMRPFSLQPLDTLRMLADDDGAGGVIYRYNDPINGEVRLPESEIIHVRGPRTGGFYGDSAMARAAGALALAKAQEDYASAYYGNGALPGILLKPPPAHHGSLTKEQKNTIREAWKTLHAGTKKTRGVAVTDPGWAVEVIETDAAKSQMVEARRYQVAEIARYFGVPGHLVGVPEASQGYGKNLAELGLGFVRQTLQPWARRVEEELRRKLMPGRRGHAWFIEYDLTRLTKGDDESVARAAEIDLRTGVLTINEARAMRALPSVKGGDITLVNGKPLDQVLKEPEPQPQFQPTRDEPEESDTADAGAPVNTRPDSNALERHARRVKARAADLRAKGKTEPEIEAAVAGLRAKARSEIWIGMGDLDAKAVDAALEAVEHGVAPAKALARLLGDA